MEDSEQRERDRGRRSERQSRFSDDKQDHSRDRERRNRENRIYVSNVPYDYRWTEVKDLFRERVGDVAFVELFNDENDRPRGCGIVEFTNPESVKRAMEVMHRFSIKGRKLVIKEDNGDERDKFGRLLKSGGKELDLDNRPKRNDKVRENVGNFDSGEQYNTYGLSVQFLNSIGVDGPLVNKVFVANLDYKVDIKKMKEVFKLAGKVRNIDLSMDKDGKSRGFAVVEYEHPVEAVQAISLFDKQYLYERKINVRLDRVPSDKNEIRLPEGLKGIGIGLGPNGEPLRDVARNIPQNSTTNNNIGLGPGLLSSLPSSTLSLNSLNAATLGNAVLGAAAPFAGLSALGLNMGNLQNQILQQASNELAMSNNVPLSNPNINVQGRMVGNGNMSGFARPSTLTTNFSQSNMGPNNRGQMGNSFNNQQTMDMGNASPAGIGFRNMGRDGDMMQNNRQEKSMDTIVITNLPSTITWQLLREKFSEAGDIKYAEKSDKETAIITYQMEYSAERAIKLFDRTRIDGRTINVNFY